MGKLKSGAECVSFHFHSFPTHASAHIVAETRFLHASCGMLRFVSLIVNRKGELKAKVVEIIGQHCTVLLIISFKGQAYNWVSSSNN